MKIRYIFYLPIFCSLIFILGCQNDEEEIVEEEETLPIIWERSFTVDPLGGGSSSGAFAFTGVEQDANGFIYTTGWFVGVLDFNEKNSGDGDLELYVRTGEGSKNSNFAAKFTEDGKAVWLVPFVGGADMAMDENDNIYLAGEGLWKLNSHGEVLWNTNTEARSIAYDINSASIFTAGSFQRPRGGRDNFVRKIDARSGDVDWSRTIETSDDSWGEAVNVACNNNGDIVSVGGYDGELTLVDGKIIDSSKTNIVDNGSIYIAKWNINGDIEWIKTQIGGTVTQGALVLDDKGRIFHAGEHSDVQLEPGNEKSGFSSIGITGDSFFSALDENGNYLWGDSYKNSLRVCDLLYKGSEIHVLAKADLAIASQLYGDLFVLPKSDKPYGVNNTFSTFIRMDIESGTPVASSGGTYTNRRPNTMDELLIDQSGNYIYAGKLDLHQPYLAKEKM